MQVASISSFMPKVSKALFLCGLFSITGCFDLNDSRYPYDSGYNSGYGYGDDYYNRRERERLEEEREDIERERDRLERERRRQEERERESQQPAYRPPPPRQQEHCPSGFSPSENKCSPEERRHGCRDMRLPGGLGCVSR